VSVAYKHVSEAPQPVRERNPQVPEQLEAVTMRCLAKNPANRYHSADELAADLRRFRAGQAVQAEALLPEELTAAIAASPGATRAVPATAAAATRVNQRVDAPAAYPVEPPRRSPIFLIVLVLLLAGVAALVALLAVNLNLGSGGTTKVVAVDGVVGFQQAEATRRLEAAGFKVNVVSEQNDANPGTVISQSPQSGTKVASGTTVEIHVSAAKAPVPVPNVVGKNKDVADQLMRAKGLIANFIPEQNDNVPVDTVIRQNPGEGQTLAPGSEVDVVISAGKGTAQVPNLRGHPAATATNELGLAGFTAAQKSETSNEVGPGDVIRMDPSAGTVVDRGSTVTIIVSSGPPTTTTTAGSGTTTTTTH
jgi:serine/threonine-protein kinase